MSQDVSRPAKVEWQMSPHEVDALHNAVIVMPDRQHLSVMKIFVAALSVSNAMVHQIGWSENDESALSHLMRKLVDAVYYDHMHCHPQGQEVGQ